MIKAYPGIDVTIPVFWVLVSQWRTDMYFLSPV
jgi:hypothetical protein